MKKILLAIHIFIMVSLISSCEFNRSLEGETINSMSEAGRTSNYAKYGELYLYSAFLDIPTIEDTTGSYIPPLALASNKIALANLSGKVMLLTGRNTEWIAQLDSNAVAMAAMAADQKQNLYIIANNDVLYSFSETGKLRWKQHFPRQKKGFIVYSDLLVVSDGIVIGSSAGLLAKMDFDGNKIWETNFSIGISRTFSADEKGNLVIPLTHKSFGKTDTLLYTDTQGKSVWKWQKDGFRIMSYPVVSNDIIYIVCTSGSSNEQTNHAFALDMSGNILWEHGLDAIPRFISVDNDGNLYVISYDIGLGKTITVADCLSKNGDLMWEKYFETTAYSPLIIGRDYIMFSGEKPSTRGVYFLEKNGNYVKTVSLSNLPDIVMRPEVKPDGVAIFAGSSRLSIIRIDEIWINKVIPW